ncbi:ammonia-dependent NAD(+) synthetase [Proteobacteria bacterium 005FR1]|nr:ammonia-dependent NAD(+) synthetase [Proteobacteria bacterium 005FR1]
MDARSNKQVQQEIISALNAVPAIDAGVEVDRRVAFLHEQMESSDQHALVLGISGGVDSTVAGRLAQKAAERARQQGMSQVRFIAMRLPYGEQRDEADAQRALDFIAPDEVMTVNIKSGSDEMLAMLEAGGLRFRDAFHRDFVMGNIKARQRMIAQYAVAGARKGLVIGTDHAAEALMGFFTKYGDGACDVAPLTGLNKRQVREVGRELGAPHGLVEKQPTADLESLNPGKSDEDALGVSYREIDDFLEGKPVSDHAFETIFRAYNNTEHKRNTPIEPI